jgi:hypothetical protein
MVFGMFHVLALLVGCSMFGETTPTPAPAPPPPAEPEKPAVEVGRLPLEYPVMTTSAAAGEMVLAPSREFYDTAVEKGMDQATFIYYLAEMVEPGPAESKVKSLAGTEYMIPNSLIVGLPKGATAQPGDVLLGHWESGSGMYRAVAVAGGTPEAPMVRYMDGTYKAEDKPDTWQANRFKPLAPGEVGVSVACKKDDQVHHGTLLSATPKKLLSLEFAGKIAMYETANCMPIPPKPEVKAGDKVQVPYIGTYREATVTKVDAAVGRVFAKFEFGGAEKEEAFGWMDVATALDKYGEGFVPSGTRGGDGEGKAGKGKAGEGKAGDGEGKAGKGGGGGGKAKGGKGGKAD